MTPELKQAILKLCEAPADALIDVINELLQIIEMQEAALYFYAKHHHHLNTTAPNFALEAITETTARLEKLAGS